MNRLETLSMKLFDAVIDEAELEELVELTRSTDGRDAFLQLARLESYLHLSGRSSAADDVVAALQEQRVNRVEAAVMDRITEVVRPSEVVAEAVRGKSGSRLPALVMAVVVLAGCLAFAVLPFGANNRDEPGIVRLSGDGAVVSVTDSAGASQSVSVSETPISVSVGQTIKTSRATDSVELIYRDGTTVALMGRTAVKVSAAANGAKELTLLSGLIQADVAPQPIGQPLRIITATAKLEVLGTTLGVKVLESSTQLEVATGVVAMTRSADGERVEVEAGQLATATDSTSEPLTPRPFPVLPDIWSEDFADGLPEGWSSGEFVEEEGALASRAVGSNHKRGNIAVTTQNAWREGQHALFQIHDDSVLHFRIRQTKFARITVMVATRAYPPERGRFGVNLFYTKKAWNEDLQPGVWKTISIPLRDVGWHVRKGKKNGGAPKLAGLASYLIQVTTMDRDVGLTIDRLWVTR